jgi:hypothetical protein
VAYQPGSGGFYQQQSGVPPVTIGRVPPEEKKRPSRRLMVFLIVSGALVLLVAVAGAFGGLRAQPDGPEHLTAGRTVNQGLFDVQILDARAGRMKSSSFDPPQNQLVVRMRVTNLGDQTYGVTTFLYGIAAEPRPGTFVAPDLMKSNGDVHGYGTSSIHPRLPVLLQLVWPLPEGTTPHSVTVALRMWDYSQSFTTDTFYWSATKQSPITAEVAVPVRTGATS